MNDYVTRYGSSALAALAFLVVAPGLAGAQEVDRRWLPWTGCWEVVGDQESNSVVCVGAGETTSEIVLVDGNVETPDIRIRADGQPRDVDQFGCAGTERAWFSPDGSRIYTEGEYLCEDGVEQSSTGVIAMVAPDEWVDIRSLEMGGEKVAWVQRYVAGTPGSTREADSRDAITPQQILARRMAARRPNNADLMEVASVVDARVAAAWMGAVGAEFDLDGKTLLAMHDAGIDPEVIDVAIAVSNPDRFVLGAEGMPDARPDDPTRTAFVGGPPVSAFGGCWGANSFFLPWGPAFGCGLGFGYSPYAYGGWGGAWGGGWGWGGWGGGYWGPVVVVPGERPSGSSGSRAVAGRGYRGPRNQVAPTGSGATMRTPPRSGAPSGGSVTRSSPGSRGGAARGGTRRAKPKGGGF
jgi:hypothetical protein